MPNDSRKLKRERARILQPWLLGLLALAVTGVLATAYPRSTLQRRLLDGDKPNALSVAYLEAWLRVAPDDRDFIGVLAAQYLRVGRFDDAGQLADRMAKSNDDELRHSAVLISTGIGEARAYGMTEDNPARAAAMDDLRSLFDIAAEFKWQAPVLRTLAQRAIAAGASKAAISFYQQLSVIDHSDAVDSQMRITQLALGSRAYERAADAYFNAQSRVGSVAEQRQYFMSALAAYQSGGLLDQALAEGEKHLGRLQYDPLTIETMLNLARSANRRDMIQRYAKALSNLTSALDPRKTDGKDRLADAPVAANSRRGTRRIADHGHASASRWKMWHTVVAHPDDFEGWYYADGPRAMRRAGGADGVRLQRVTATLQDSNASAGTLLMAQVALAASASEAPVKVKAPAAAPMRASMSAADREHYDDLAYEAFLESADVTSAMRLAQRRVNADPTSSVWQRRLAQSAEWSNQPMIALQAWHAVAEQTNAVDAWQQVLRIAPALNDDEAYVDALLHQSDLDPKNLKRVDAVVDAYERLGRPDDALAFLKRREVGTQRIDVMRRYAALAQRAGQDDLAEATYVELQKIAGPNADDALRLANLYYAHRDYKGAFGALKVALPVATTANENFWRTYGQLARMLENDDAVHLANSKLLAGNHATDEDLGDMAYFYDGHPLDAGRIAELQYRNTGTPRALQDAIYYYVQARAWPRLTKLLASLTPKERAVIDNSPDALAMIAEYERQTRQPQAALRDLRRAASLPGASPDVQSAYLWTLVDFGSDDELRETIGRWRDRSLDVAALWGPYAAGLVRLNRPAEALAYFRREASASKGDPLWVLALADAEEAAGNDQSAWSLRRYVWTQLLALDPDAGPLPAGAPSRGRLPAGLSNDDAERREELRQRRVTLSEMFENGDSSKRVLIEMLRADGAQSDTSTMQESVLGNVGKLPKVDTPAVAGGVAAADAPLTRPGQSSGGKITRAPLSPDDPLVTAGMSPVQLKQQRQISSAAIEVSVAWALSKESDPLAKAWLTREYANRLTRPVDAELSVALADHDIRTIDRVLDSKGASRVRVENRIDAYELADRQGEAQTLAFLSLDGAPANDDLHARLSDLATDRNQSVYFGVRSVTANPLAYWETKVGGELALSDHFSIALQGIQLNQRTTNAQLLTGVPSTDRTFNFIGHYQTTSEDVALVLGRRDALTSFYTQALSAEFGRGTPLHFTFQIGRNQFADESQEVQVGGVKDMLRGEVEWDVLPRVFVRGSLEGDYFYAQDRQRIGSGALMDGEIGYRFRIEYPDVAVRIVGTHGNYSPEDSTVPFLQRLVPVGDIPTAATFMPQSYSQYGIAAGFGTDLLERYTRAWRPFLDVGLIHDSNFGWGPQILVGLAGSVFGNDHAAVYYQHEAVSNLGTSTTEFGVRYRWLF
ncbi:tetratricopeptide repeat protein [Pararobbsia alpina]|nr:tetratricopeptide repeat protein [Pararobbsia alpina]